MAGLLAVSLSACDWEREEDSQRENEADSLGQLDDRFKIEDAEVAWERATFEENMHQTVTSYAQQVQDLKASVAELPELKQQEGKQMVA